MKYTQKSFTALGSESNTYTHARAVCGSVGHMEPDVRGKCLRCGEKVDAREVYLRSLFEPGDHVGLISSDR